MAKFKNKVSILTQKYRKCSQEELAKLVGGSQSNIGRYENGSSEPSLKTLIDIAEALNVTTDQLLGVGKPMVEKTVPELTPEQLQIVELIKKLPKEDLQKVYGYLLGLIDARS